MEYLYFMSTFSQTICYGHYVIIIRTIGINPKHQPNIPTARILFVQYKRTTGIHHISEGFRKRNYYFVKGAPSRIEGPAPDFINGRVHDLSRETKIIIFPSFIFNLRLRLCCLLNLADT